MDIVKEYDIALTKDEIEIYVEPILNAKDEDEARALCSRFETLLRVKLREKERRYKG
jgi:hypothetical protein